MRLLHCTSPDLPSLRWPNIKQYSTGAYKSSLLLSSLYRLYTLDGELVKHAADLQNNGLYVACGFEKFVPCDYGNEPPPIIVSPRRPYARRS